MPPISALAGKETPETGDIALSGDDTATAAQDPPFVLHAVSTRDDSHAVPAGSWT